MDELRDAVDRRAVDTVIVAFPDMQGRLMGKRLTAEFFLEEASVRALEGCGYLLAVDMEMQPVPGYEIASWERGYGDIRLVPDLATLRILPWLEATALVIADLTWPDGSPVRQAPRQVLREQVARAGALGYEPMIGSELEFYLLKETYEEARARHFRGLTPSAPYAIDYYILGTTYDEPFLRLVRSAMHGAEICVESSKGEASPGQHEINLRFTDALGMADAHVIYKNGIKEMAHQHGHSVTFMAKPDHQWLGSSCHIHTSLWHEGRNAFEGESDTFRTFLAGQIALAREAAIFLAPSVNSFKRFVAKSWAPTTLAWGRDNRTCAFRVVGGGASLRIETRLAGADANPYLAISAILAAGLHGVQNSLQPPIPCDGNAYDGCGERFPSSLREAICVLEQGRALREALGADVIDHYLNYARTEQRLFDETVTCYERERMFERG